MITVSGLSLYPAKLLVLSLILKVVVTLPPIASTLLTSGVCAGLSIKGNFPIDAKTPEKKVTPKNLRTEALSTAELIDWFHVKAKPPFAKK